MSRTARMAGRSYVAGAALQDALETGRYLSARGYGYTLGYWNRRLEPPESVRAEAMAALAAVADEGEDGYLSLKVPPLGFDGGHCRAIFDEAQRRGVPVHLDSHSPHDADATLALLCDRSSPINVGVTLPGRWRRSLRDAELAMDKGAVVRVVKGQWPDPEGGEGDLREGFLALIDRLSGRASRVRVASHDAELVAHSVDRLQRAGTHCEIELLYGLPLRTVLPVASIRQVPVRVYVPYGVGTIPYALRYLRANPHVLWWLFKDATLGSRRNRFPVIARSAAT